jgi:hypothetical protein
VRELRGRVDLNLVNRREARVRSLNEAPSANERIEYVEDHGEEAHASFAKMLQPDPRAA